MRWCIHQLMHCHQSGQLNLILLHNPSVLNQLPRQLVAELLEGRDRIGTTKETVCEVGIYLANREYKGEHSDLPASCCHRVLDRRESMPQVVVVIDGVTILVVPVVRKRKSRLLYPAHPPFRPVPLLRFAFVRHNQQPSCRHHLHHIARLLQPPQEVLLTIELPRDPRRLSHLPIVEKPVHGLTGNKVRPVPTFFDHRTREEASFLQCTEARQDTEPRVQNHVASRRKIGREHPH